MRILSIILFVPIIFCFFCRIEERRPENKVDSAGQARKPAKRNTRRHVCTHDHILTDEFTLRYCLSADEAA